MGFVIRSDYGVFLAGAAGKIEHVKSALHAEAVACTEAIGGAGSFGANRVIFESDSQVLVSALCSAEYDRSDFGVLVREARSLCILNFDSFEFSFCRRVCNKVAHAIAEHGYRTSLPAPAWAEAREVSDLEARVV